jgi:hypothetical protein
VGLLRKSYRSFFALLLILTLVITKTKCIADSENAPVNNLEWLSLNSVADANREAARLISENPGRSPIKVYHPEGQPILPFRHLLEVLSNNGITATGVEIKRDYLKQPFKAYAETMPSMRGFIVTQNKKTGVLNADDAESLAQAYEPQQVGVRLRDYVDRLWTAMRTVVIVEKFYESQEDGSRRRYRPTSTFTKAGVLMGAGAASMLAAATFRRRAVDVYTASEMLTFAFGYTFVATVYSPVLAKIFRQYNVLLFDGGKDGELIKRDENEVASLTLQWIMSLFGILGIKMIENGYDLVSVDYSSIGVASMLGTFFNAAANRASHKMMLAGDTTKKAWHAAAFATIWGGLLAPLAMFEAHDNWQLVAGFAALTLGIEYVRSHDKLLTHIGKSIYSLKNFTRRLKNAPVCGSQIVFSAPNLAARAIDDLLSPEEEKAVYDSVESAK